jgi:hypothetical protein
MTLSHLASQIGPISIFGRDDEIFQMLLISKEENSSGKSRKI